MTAQPRIPEQLLRRLLALHRRALVFRDLHEDRLRSAGVDREYRRRLDARQAALDLAGAGRVLIDVTSLCKPKRATSVDRVVLSLLSALQRLPIRVEPVAFEGSGYRTVARRPDEGDPARERLVVTPAEVQPRRGDHLLIVELDYRMAQPAFAWLARARQAGLEVSVLVLDVFLLVYPEWFPLGETLAFHDWLLRVVAVADRLLLTSQSAARQLKTWHEIVPAGDSAATRRIPLAVFDLGADAVRSTPSPAMLPASQGAQGFTLPHDGPPAFLTVAALHPRKGVDTLIDAFSSLWAGGADLRLVLSGRTIDRRIASAIRAHPESGKRLFYPGFLGDVQIAALARQVEAMIIPSRDEGFGLPMAEAGYLGLPVIARDIPVFREIAGAQPWYFGAGEGNDLATRIRQWLDLEPARKRDHVPVVAARTWQESARQLTTVLLTDTAFDAIEWPLR